MDSPSACVVLMLCQTCWAAWDTAKYEVVGRTSVVPVKKRVESAAEYIQSWYCGVMINYGTLEVTPLKHFWCRSPTVTGDFLYMFKTYNRDIYRPPVS